MSNLNDMLDHEIDVNTPKPTKIASAVKQAGVAVTEASVNPNLMLDEVVQEFPQDATSEQMASFAMADAPLADFEPTETPWHQDMYAIHGVVSQYKQDFDKMPEVESTAVVRAFVANELGVEFDSMDDDQALGFMNVDNMRDAAEGVYYATQTQFGPTDVQKFEHLDDDAKFEQAKESWMAQAQPGQSISNASLIEWQKSQLEHNPLTLAKTQANRMLETPLERKIVAQIASDDGSVEASTMELFNSLDNEAKKRVVRVSALVNPTRHDGGITSVLGAFVDGAGGWFEGAGRGVERIGELDAGQAVHDRQKFEYQLNQVVATKFDDDYDFSRQVSYVLGDMATTLGVSAIPYVGVGLAVGGNTARYGGMLGDTLQFEYGMDAGKATAWGLAGGAGMAVIENVQIGHFTKGAKALRGTTKTIEKGGKVLVETAKAGAGQIDDVAIKSFRKSLSDVVSNRAASDGFNKFLNAGGKYIGVTAKEAGGKYIGVTATEIGEEWLQAAVEAGVSWIAVATEQDIDDPTKQEYFDKIRESFTTELIESAKIMPVVSAIGASAGKAGKVYQERAMNKAIADVILTGTDSDVKRILAYTDGVQVNYKSVAKQVAKSNTIDVVSTDPERDVKLDRTARLALLEKAQERSNLFYSVEGGSNSLKVADAQYGAMWANSDKNADKMLKQLTTDGLSKRDAGAVVDILEYRDKLKKQMTKEIEIGEYKVDNTMTESQRLDVYAKTISTNIEVSQGTDIDAVESTINKTFGDNVTVVRQTHDAPVLSKREKRHLRRTEGKEASKRTTYETLEVTMPNGKGVTVVFNNSDADIQGNYKAVDGIDSRDIITINSKTADSRTVLHEMFHAIESNLLTDKEIAILSDSGLTTVDQRAEAFADYHVDGVVVVDKKVKTVLEKLADFFNPFKRNPLDVFKSSTKMKSKFGNRVSIPDSNQQVTNVSTDTLTDISSALAKELSLGMDKSQSKAFVTNLLRKFQAVVADADMDQIVAEAYLLKDSPTPRRAGQEVQINKALSGTDNIIGLPVSKTTYAKLDGRDVEVRDSAKNTVRAVKPEGASHTQRAKSRTKSINAEARDAYIEEYVQQMAQHLEQTHTKNKSGFYTSIRLRNMSLSQKLDALFGREFGKVLRDGFDLESVRHIRARYRLLTNPDFIKLISDYITGDITADQTQSKLETEFGLSFESTGFEATDVQSSVESALRAEYFGPWGDRLNAIIKHDTAQSAIVKYLGSDFAKSIDNHLQYFQTDQRPSASNSWANKAKSLVSLSTMMLNFRSFFAQFTSVPIAFVSGGLNHHAFSNYTNRSQYKADLDTLKNEYGFEAERKQSGFSDVFADVQSNIGTRSRVGKVASWLVLSRHGDLAIYRRVAALKYRQSLDEQRNDPTNNNSDAVMRDRAAAEAFGLVQRTQQSARIENLGDIQLSQVGSFFAQFQTTTLMQARIVSGAFQNYRDAVNLSRSNPTNTELAEQATQARWDLVRDSFALLVQQSVYLATVALITNQLLGDEDEDLEEYLADVARDSVTLGLGLQGIPLVEDAIAGTVDVMLASMGGQTRKFYERDLNVPLTGVVKKTIGNLEKVAKELRKGDRGNLEIVDDAIKRIFSGYKQSSQIIETVPERIEDIID